MVIEFLYWVFFYRIVEIMVYIISKMAQLISNYNYFIKNSIKIKINNRYKWLSSFYIEIFYRIVEIMAQSISIYNYFIKNSIKEKDK